MDINIFAFFNVVIFGLLLFSMVIRKPGFDIMMRFFAVIVAMFMILGVNSDGGLTQLACTATTCSANSISGTWPAVYIPLFGLLMNAIAAIRAAMEL